MTQSGLFRYITFALSRVTVIDFVGDDKRFLFTHTKWATLKTFSRS